MGGSGAGPHRVPAVTDSAIRVLRLSLIFLCCQPFCQPVCRQESAGLEEQRGVARAAFDEWGDRGTFPTCPARTPGSTPGTMWRSGSQLMHTLDIKSHEVQAAEWRGRPTDAHGPAACSLLFAAYRSSPAWQPATYTTPCSPARPHQSPTRTKAGFRQIPPVSEPEK